MVVVAAAQVGVDDERGHGQGHDVGGQVGDAPSPDGGILDAHPESQAASSMPQMQVIR